MGERLFDGLPDLLTPDEAAASIRMSRSWIYKCIKTKRLAAKKLGSHIVIDKQIFIEFLKQQGEEKGVL